VFALYAAIPVLKRGQDAPMRIKIAKWGGSLAVRIPAALANEIGARAGDTAEMTVEDGVLVLAPAGRRRTRRRYTLEQLVRGMTKDNVHPETDWGPPRGNEVW
jgi:antitoxin MazE